MNDTPAGSVPLSVMVGVGLPVAAGVKLLATPSTNVTESAEVKAGVVP